VEEDEKKHMRAQKKLWNGWGVFIVVVWEVLELFIG